MGNFALSLNRLAPRRVCVYLCVRVKSPNIWARKGAVKFGVKGDEYLGDGIK